MSNAKLARRIIWRKQRGKCYYCAKRTRLPRKNETALNDNVATLDHVVARGSGGSKSTRDNCVVACYECNNARGNKDARLFMLERGLL